MDNVKVILAWYKDYLINESKDSTEESGHYKNLMNSDKFKGKEEYNLRRLLYTYHRIGMFTNEYFSSCWGNTNFTLKILKELDNKHIKYINDIKNRKIFMGTTLEEAEENRYKIIYSR